MSLPSSVGDRVPGGVLVDGPGRPAANSKLTLCIGLLGFIFFASMICVQRGDRVFTGRNDFAQIYAGARLSGTPELYSRAADYRLIRRQIGTTLEGVICTRLPYYYLLLKPLGWMPYGVAYGSFLFLNAAALAGFVLLARRWLPEAPAFIGWSIPAVIALANGQDSLLLLFVVAYAVYLHQKGHRFAVGLLLSLGSIKFHLFLFVPLVLLFRRDWKTIRGGLAGAFLQAAISFAAQGIHWPADYSRIIANPEITPCLGCMMNLRGAAFTLAGRDSAPIWLLLYALASLGCLLILSRKPSFEIGIAWALICGMLVSHHAAIQDFVLLLLPFVLIVRESKVHIMRAILAVAVTPLPYLVVNNVALPAMLLVLVGLQTALMLGLNWPARVTRAVAVRPST